MKEKDVKFSVEEPNPETQDNIVDINTDENISGSMQLGETNEQDAEIERLQEEIQNQKDKYLRLFADFDNVKKRAARERLELMQTAGKEVIMSLLDVLDDCDRAEKQLQGRGLRAMESLDTDFDVEKHEAITEIPAPSEALKGKVLDELQKGYYLNDKIIRFAKVVVGK